MIILINNLVLIGLIIFICESILRTHYTASHRIFLYLVNLSVFINPMKQVILEHADSFDMFPVIFYIINIIILHFLLNIIDDGSNKKRIFDTYEFKTKGGDNVTIKVQIYPKDESNTTVYYNDAAQITTSPGLFILTVCEEIGLEMIDNTIPIKYLNSNWGIMSLPDNKLITDTIYNKPSIVDDEWVLMESEIN